MKRWIALFFCLFVVAQARAAHAEGSVVGVSDRHEFGAWAWRDDAPRLLVGLGLGGGMVTLRDSTLAGGTKAAPIQGPAGVIDGTRIFATTIELRPRFFLAGPLYFGPAIGIGPAFTTHEVTSDGAHVAGTGFYAQLGGLLGVSLRPSRSDVSFSLETIVAARIANFSVRDAGQDWIASSVTPLVQPRLQIDYWTTAWSTVGVWIGADALHEHDTAAGIAFAFHIAPFDEGPPER